MLPGLLPSLPRTRTSEVAELPKRRADCGAKGVVILAPVSRIVRAAGLLPNGITLSGGSGQVGMPANILPSGHIAGCRSMSAPVITCNDSYVIQGRVQELGGYPLALLPFPELSGTPSSSYLGSLSIHGEQGEPGTPDPS